MNNTEIRAALSKLQEMEFYLEEEYEQNGGEVTEHTEEQEAAIAALRELLTTEGVDSLGRWYTSVEAKIAMHKAEKEAISRKIKSAEDLLDFIKRQVGHILKITGTDKVKGTFYTFSQFHSVKTSVNKDFLNDLFLDSVEAKLRKGKKPVIPNDVTITLSAKSSLLEEGAKLPAYYIVEEADTSKFQKPRKAKEVKEEL